MSNEFDKLKQEEAEKSARLQELTYVSNKFGRIIDNKLTQLQLDSNIKEISDSNNNPINSCNADRKEATASSPTLSNKFSNNLGKIRFSKMDNDKIENICDYYDELQYNLDCYNNNVSDSNGNLSENPTKNVKKLNTDNTSKLNLSSKVRKNLMNRKLIDRRAKFMKDNLNLEAKLQQNNDSLKQVDSEDKSLLSNIITQLENAALPSLHLHLILSLTMVILTHRCPQYLIVL